MALFKRADLEKQGLSKEQIDFIMTESGRSLSANYTLNSDIQGRIDEAVTAAKGQVTEITATPEYVALAKENAKLKAFGTDDFSAVKAPYRDMIWDKLDHGEKAKPYGEQLIALRETMPDIFNAEKPEPQAPQGKPMFGAPTVGSIPTGEQSVAQKLSDACGFIPKR